MKQVVRCCLEHAASVAKTFITSDAVVVDIKEPEKAAAAGNPMGGSGTRTCSSRSNSSIYCMLEQSLLIVFCSGFGF